MTILTRIVGSYFTTTVTLSLIALLGCGQSAENLGQVFGKSSDSKESATNLAATESNRTAPCVPNGEEADDEETEEHDEGDENEGDEEDDENESGLDLHREKKKEKKKEKSKQKESIENGCPASTSTSTSTQTRTSTSPMTDTTTTTSTAPTTSTGTSTSTSAALDGARLYQTLCENCHNPKATTDIVDKSAAGTRTAIQNVRSMRSIQATDAELAAISKYLTTP